MKKGKNKTASELGKIGGNACVEKHGRGYMHELAKKGAAARWNKN